MYFPTFWEELLSYSIINGFGIDVNRKSMNEQPSHIWGKQATDGEIRGLSATFHPRISLLVLN